MNLDGLKSATCSPQARHHFTVADQVNQLVAASEADPERGFMARTMALCSLPPHQPRQPQRVQARQRAVHAGDELGPRQQAPLDQRAYLNRMLRLG